MAEPYGIKIGYHNHSKEFYVDEGLPLLEHVANNSKKCYMSNSPEGKKQFEVQ